MAASRKPGVAAQGRARLRNPHKYPWQLRYIHVWALSLLGRSGYTDAGMSPLSYPVFESWARMNGVESTTQERDAVFEIDTAMRSNGEDD